MTITQQSSANAEAQLKRLIESESERLGFQQMGVGTTDLGPHIAHYRDWLEQGFHADLDYMQQHGAKRWIPEQLIPGTLRVISLRMNYVSDGAQPLNILKDSRKAYVSRYALGRDYHKLIRSRLKKLIGFIREQAGQYNLRAFVDSAPVLERALAQRSGLGWFGKNTMLINREAGSWFFLGEIYTDLELPTDPPYQQEHCGRCTTCLEECPTQAFVGPYLLDTARCISYLTIEHKGSIPLELRPLIGNRIFGCDDCQLVCPWTRFTQKTSENDFSPRHQLDNSTLIDLFNWDEETFLTRTEGSPIRRAGYECWQRNIAVAMGNADYDAAIIEALRKKLASTSAMVNEHITWALDHLQSKCDQ